MRGYPFFRYVGAMLVGIFVAEAWPGSFGWVVGIGLLATLVFGTLLYRNEQRLVRPLNVAQGLAGLVLFGVVGWLAVALQSPKLQPDHLVNIGQLPVAYEAVVTNLPEERAKTYKVELVIRRGRLTDSGSFQALSGRVLVYLDKGDSVRPTPMPRYGDVWLVAGKPRVVDPPLNPGEFDFKRFLAHRGIFHQQYLRAWQRTVVGHAPPNRLVELAYNTNRWSDSVLTARVVTKAEFGIVNAMILGVRDDLDPAQYQSYAAAGAVHILSVSGMHVGILFVVLNWLLTWVARGKGNSWWVVNIKLAVLWFFALMTGFSAPVLRSALMFSFLLVAGLTNRTQSLLNTLAASALVLLCYDPFAAFSAGFQLSYLAVAGIGAWVPYLNQLMRPTSWMGIKLWQMSVVALAAQLLTFPLGIYYFHSFPTYFLLANPVVMVLSAILVPLSIATLAFGWIPVLGDLLGWLLQKTAWLMNYSVEAIGRFPGAMPGAMWLSLAGLLVVYALIWAVCLLLLTRSRTYLNLTLVLACCFALLVIYEKRKQDNQQRLTVHFLPRKTAVSLVSGHHALVLTDDDWQANSRNYDFYLKNTFGQWGIDSLTVGSLRADSLPVPLAYQHQPDLALAVWHGRSILFVNRLSACRQWQLPKLIDYVVLRRTAVHDWASLTRHVVARHIILDDSNVAGPTDSLLAQTPPPGVAVHAIRRDGVFTAEW
ncbi:ComEC/Rec2 family competence protein [Fibrivirga algicola]|uniref:ComEC family competence protein n=1 Tax=Fibrivirga algicola TaxID=2950420 RepID=A0ABX0QLR0_9BACT|nr:ComEC/Rec2 family competence protein [Fibrivirga algicola]NID11069.1 ComEC family competence protein [Fibrivirga algicola]